MAVLDKTALVIGGSGGLGRAICETLAREWAGVFFTYRGNRAAAESLAGALAGQCQTGHAACDLRDTGSIAAAVDAARQQFGRVDAVMFAGGVRIAQPFVSQIGESDWHEVIDTELMGFTRLVAAVLPVFRQQGGGVFVSVTSFANEWFPPGDALSSVPKAGIESLSRAIAKEEGRYNIRSNCVAPGIIDAGLGAAFQKELFNSQVWEEQRRRVPMRRFGDAADIAEAVAFLASDRSRYITGQTIIVDGGLSL